MKYVFASPGRHSIRLKGFDYSSPGAYFVTLCAHRHVCMFGEIINGQMRLNQYGQIVKDSWHDLVHHITNIEIGEFVVMPNHFHGVIQIVDRQVRAGSEPALTKPDEAQGRQKSLPEIVRQLKTFSAIRINESRGTPGARVWQRNYWERIIRNETEYHNIILYIQNNPFQWEQDKLYPG